MAGHALGLDHTQENCDATLPPIMCPDSSGPNLLRPEDIAGIGAKYCRGPHPPSKLTAGGGGDQEDSQYEALFQAAAVVAGVDLNGDSNYSGPGEIHPLDARFGWGGATKRIILLITDSDLHNSEDVAEKYPCSGAGAPMPCSNEQAHGRAMAISALRLSWFRGASVITPIAANPPDLTSALPKDDDIGILAAQDHGHAIARATESVALLVGGSSQHLAPAVVARLEQVTRFLTGNQIATLSEYGVLALVLVPLTTGLALVR